jgi:hypothetical protein
VSRHPVVLRVRGRVYCGHEHVANDEHCRLLSGSPFFSAVHVHLTRIVQPTPALTAPHYLSLPKLSGCVWWGGRTQWPIACVYHPSVDRLLLWTHAAAAAAGAD